jgi:serine O-acetyltransferase
VATNSDLQRGVAEDALIAALLEGRSDYCFPGRLKTLAADLARQLLGLIFPHFSEFEQCDPVQMGSQLDEIRAGLRGFLVAVSPNYPEADPALPDRFLAELPAIRCKLIEDAEAADLGDPASTSVNEVILAYPGFYAVAVYRLAHALHQLGYPLLPRLLTEFAHAQTGVDIHPGASIGSRFFIDHGTGIVIGGTAVVGDNVKLYQGVTLGALAVKKNLAAKKRHPTLEDDVVVYANATILGGSTIVGKGSIIGGNVWLPHSVAPGSVVTHHSDIRVRVPGEELALDYQI